ncbi:TRAP-type C4-dicarboxylate transport system, small permease component [Rubellimicrobium thermophilum DSM 16684]|uniref:TRAP transporter small permease protein n=1 Tax=Rubellimicrobium thermophilum DSM 16684 TaxID=1123069 RepID=S9SC08_9RHOB|nr:TRAP transporter small permease [Rubellimicrobium thermophilum]EPX83779.1 TRAP-type C4-dicarboxylate transport system, small permease component [Rubellimicrobium thermophilum DSM 16684]
MALHLYKALLFLCRLAAGLSFTVLILAVLVQVMGRSVFASAPVWTEELTRFALLYLAAFAAGLSYLSGDLVNVDVICESLPGRLPLILRFVSALATSTLCAALLLPAWRFTVIGSLQTSPALGWRMHYIHASVLVMLFSILVFALARVVAMVVGTNDGRPLADGETSQ